MSIRSFLKATRFWKDNSFIIREFKHFRKVAILAVVFTIIGAAFEGFGVGLILSFLQSLTNPNAQQARTGISWLDIWITGGSGSVNERLYRICTLIIVTTLLRSIFNYLARLYTNIAQFNLGHRLRKSIFEQLQALSLSYFIKTRAGELIHSITGESAQIMQAFSVIATLFSKIIILLVYVVAMFLLSWQLTIVSVMLFSLLSAGISTLMGKIREASFEKTKASKRYTSLALEYINGIRTVQAFAVQNFERKRFDYANSQVLQASKQAVAISAGIEPFSEGLATTILIGMLILAFATLIPSGQLQTASLLTFLFVLLRLMPVVRQVDGARVQFNNFQGSLSNIRELLRTDNKPYFKNGEIQFSRLEKAIEFIAVDFGYNPKEMVLHNISLTINRGEMTALVGASGAGKSTLADLIPRFFDPTEGKILVDEVDLREFEINSLRRKLAVVSQDTFIFNTSVSENIAYGMEQIDEAAILEVAHLSNALEFIQKLPEGFKTQLGDRGVRLSGGQRQRIAIARALLRNPDILILDEATSALDSVSERLIQESLEKLSVGRTVIAVAHRLSTIVRADKVVVLQHGRIVEQGGYQELLARRGELWKYHQIQHELS